MSYRTRLTEADLDRQIAHKQPLGLDYQGRHPEAAEAATEIGCEAEDAFGFFRGLAVAITFTVALLAVSTVLAAIFN